MTRTQPPLTPNDRRQKAIFDEPGTANTERAEPARGRGDPPPDAALDARVRAVLDSLTPDGRTAMAVSGRRICDQLAEEAQARRDLKAASEAVADGIGEATPMTPATRLALDRASPKELTAMPNGRLTFTPRADGPDRRWLAQELGRDALVEMLGHLDRIDAERAERAAREPRAAGCGAVDEGPDWAAPERCARTHDDDTHRARSGFEWTDEDVMEKR